MKFATDSKNLWPCWLLSSLVLALAIACGPDATAPTPTPVTTEPTTGPGLTPPGAVSTPTNGGSNITSEPCTSDRFTELMDTSSIIDYLGHEHRPLPDGGLAGPYVGPGGFEMLDPLDTPGPIGPGGFGTPGPFRTPTRLAGAPGPFGTPGPCETCRNHMVRVEYSGPGAIDDNGAKVRPTNVPSAEADLTDKKTGVVSILPAYVLHDHGEPDLTASDVVVIAYWPQGIREPGKKYIYLDPGRSGDSQAQLERVNAKVGNSYPRGDNWARVEETKENWKIVDIEMDRRCGEGEPLTVTIQGEGRIVLSNDDAILVNEEERSIITP
jgi:hypothetical protein